jgi:ribose transport system substrate-binding protein
MPGSADAARIAFIHQDLGLIDWMTVAENMGMAQGWQIVDEMNRALAGQPHSGYVPPTHLFTPDNIQFDGGPNNIYDPDNGYTDAYKTIWGVP